MSDYIKLDDALKGLNIGYGKYDYVSKVADYYDSLPAIEIGKDAISRATVLEIYSDLYWMDERLLNFKSDLDKVYEKLRTAPSVVPTEKMGKWVKVPGYATPGGDPV